MPQYDINIKLSASTAYILPIIVEYSRKWYIMLLQECWRLLFFQNQRIKMNILKIITIIQISVHQVKRTINEKEIWVDKKPIIYGRI